jgi:hypothetical protein
MVDREGVENEGFPMRMLICIACLLVLPVGMASLQDDVCQNIIDSSQPVEEIQTCPAPVTTYVTEADEGWQIAIWDNAAANSADPAIAATIPDPASPPGQTALLESYHQAGINVLLYHLDSGDFEILAGPDAQGAMYDLIFTLPLDGQETRQDFALAG